MWGSARLAVRAIDDIRLVIGTIHEGNTSPEVDQVADLDAGVERRRRCP